jgi:hypothetical protein
MQEDHNNDGFAAAACLCLIHMQQRAGFAAVNQGQCRALAQRFGHTGYDNLAKMQRRGWLRALGLPQLFVAKKDELCKPCVLGKHVRTPFHTSDSRSSKPLQLLHMDLMGPMPTSTPEGSGMSSLLLRTTASCLRFHF